MTGRGSAGTLAGRIQGSRGDDIADGRQMTPPQATRIGPAIVAALCVMIASASSGADSDVRDAYAYVRRINTSAGRVAATPLQGTFHEGMPAGIFDKSGRLVCAAATTSVYPDLIYLDVSANDAARVEKGFLVAESGKPERIAALAGDPAIEKGLKADLASICAVAGPTTIDNYRFKKTMPDVFYRPRTPHHDTDCTRCHHPSEDSRKKCSTCHGNEGRSKVITLREAFHIRCRGCHTGTRLASMGCDGCHVPGPGDRSRNMTVTYYGSGSSRRSIPERMSLNEIRKSKPPVLFGHKAHADEVRGNCKVCHHKDEAGRERACSFRNCHGARAEGKKVELKEAFHKNCKDCHKKNTRKKAPTKCNDCHKK